MTEAQIDPTYRDLLLGHNAMAMDHLNRDRCLLRRDMRLAQNVRYGIEEETAADQDCEDGMGVQVGDNTVHNHYVNPSRRIPWWLWIVLVTPWLVGLAILLLYIWTHRPRDPDIVQPQPIVWELDIGSRDPE